MQVDDARVDKDDDDKDEACALCMPSLPTLPLRALPTLPSPPRPLHTATTATTTRAALPVLGLGTYELRGEACVQAVCCALRMGYRLLDTAAVYRNEELVGRGIRLSGVPRALLFVTVKLAMKTMHSAAAVRAGVLASVQKLCLDGYADAVLVHWPGCGGRQPGDAVAHVAARARCWRVLRALQREGVARHIGVSNFLPRHFAALYAHNDEDDDNEDNEDGDIVTTPQLQHDACDADDACVPAINQIELHPLCAQEDVVQYCRARGMVLQQYAPLGKGNATLWRHPQLLALHARYFAPDYSMAAMLVLWGLAQGYCTLVRSRHASHLRELYAAALRYGNVPCDTMTATATAAGGGTGAAQALPPPLTQEQRDVLQRLRTLAHIDSDTHLCWDSATIAALRCLPLPPLLQYTLYSRLSSPPSLSSSSSLSLLSHEEENDDDDALHETLASSRQLLQEQQQQHLCQLVFEYDALHDPAYATTRHATRTAAAAAPLTWHVRGVQRCCCYCCCAPRALLLRFFDGSLCALLLTLLAVALCALTFGHYVRLSIVEAYAA